MALPGPRTVSASSAALVVERPYPSVFTAPHAMALTRTPCGVQDAASERVMLLSPAFAAPYGATLGSARKLAPDEMLTIEPCPRSTMWRPAWIDMNHAPLRFWSMIWCQSAAVH